MDIYVIAPVQSLSLMNLGDRIFALAHLWIKFPYYREFIKQKKAEGYFITLDNSAAERSLVTEDVLINICKELMPNEVIAPDVLFDKEATLGNLSSFIQRMKEEQLIDKINIFGCPQGNDRDEWIECYKQMVFNNYVKVIGLSKIAVPRAFLGETKDDQGISDARRMAYDYLRVHSLLLKPIHCLGQGDPKEFEYYEHPMMRSTDSVYPVLAGDIGIDFTKEFKRIATPHNYLEVGTIGDSKLDLIKSNIEVLRRYCSEKPTN